jgi:hypothetical protein
MNLAQRLPFRNGDTPARRIEDASDDEEEALVNNYKEQVRFDDELGEAELPMPVGQAQLGEDIQSRIAAAATPLEYQATLETRFASYDNYCSLFHFILNSDGPVDLDVPSVRKSFSLKAQQMLTACYSTTGRGMLSTNLSISSIASVATVTASLGKETMPRRFRSFGTTPTPGVATACSMFFIPLFSAPK